jgi:peptide subunit release factor 1 (eRF1)
MRFSSHAQIEALTAFPARGDLVTSFYLAADKSRMPKKEIQAALKNLLSDGEARIAALEAAKDRKDALLADLDKIRDYVENSFSSLNSQGLAVFSASRSGFWQALELPHAPRNRLIFDKSFYIRPLSAIIERYRKICVLLLGRRDAVWYEVFMGGIKPLDTLKSDVPARVREGGYSGYEEKRIDRHIDAILQDHYKKVARRTLELFKNDSFDWLFIGCADNQYPDLVSHLHTYLKDRAAARVKARPSDSQAQVLKLAEAEEARLHQAEEEETVRRLIAGLESGGRAVSGLRPTLARINQFEVQTLVVTHNFSKPGFVCPQHRFLYLDETKCPVCQKKNEPVADVVDEAVEAVLKHNGRVKHVAPPSKLDHYGHIGAFLKYKS